MEYRLRGAVVQHVAFLSLHHAVLSPHSSRLQQPAAFCFSFPRPPLPFFVISQILAAFSYRYLVEIVTLSWLVPSLLVSLRGCPPALAAHLRSPHIGKGHSQAGSSFGVFAQTTLQSMHTSLLTETAARGCTQSMLNSTT